VRLFLAFDVPGRPGWHMTVAFLGSRPQDAVDELAAVVAPVIEPVGELSPRRLLKLPRRHPRVLAVEFADVSGRCGALQSAVAGALVEAGLHEPERRRWLPHVSVARLRDGEPVVAAPALEELGFTPERLVLYRSHLGHGPARYEALRSWELPARS
jgi:2'-5' RNA ligase